MPFEGVHAVACPSPSVLYVQSTLTGKKFKVTVPKVLHTGDEHYVAADITILTLKKNFSPVLCVPHDQIEVRWQSEASKQSRSDDVPGEILGDKELAPIGGVLQLSVRDKCSTAVVQSSAQNGSRPRADPVRTPPPQPPTTTYPPPAAPTTRAPLAALPAHSTTKHLSTPQRQELLDLAKHIFHDESTLSFGGDAPRATTPKHSHVVHADGSHRFGLFESGSSAPQDAGSGYESIAEALQSGTPARRRAHYATDSASRSATTSRSPSAHRDPQSTSAVWIERCLLLERQKEALEKELDNARRLLPATANTSVATASTPTPGFETSLLSSSTTRATSPSTQRIDGAATAAAVTPSPHLVAELQALKRRRKMLKDVSEAKSQESDARRNQLQDRIHNKKVAVMKLLGQRVSEVREYLRLSMPSLAEQRLIVQSQQSTLELSDGRADAEKASVDEATRRLDRCKEMMLELLGRVPTRSDGDDDAVRRKDAELAQFIAATAAQKHKHLVALERRQDATRHLRNAYDETLHLRKRLHNTVEDTKGNIRVVVRMRPMVPNDALQPQHVKYLEEGSLEVDEGRHMVYLSTPTTGIKRFEFYSVYGASSDGLAQQGRIFEEQVAPLLKSVLDGTNVAVMAYGPTGSGKTFTILGKTGDGQLSGLLPQSVEYLMDGMVCDAAHPPTAGGSPTRSIGGRSVVSCTMTMMEVYMDQVFDILGQIQGNSTSAIKLDIRQAPESGSTTGAVEVGVRTWEEAIEYIQEALKVRRTHRTLKNLESSRSHLLVTLHMVSQKDGHADPTGNTRQRSKLMFVDLAGSERISKSLSQGERLKEAQHINKSLSALGDVVHALSSTPRPSHIPYRNSRLTQLLYDAVGGNAKALLVTCICPHLPQQHNLTETQSTLQFASRVKAVRNALLPHRRPVVESVAHGDDDASTTEGSDGTGG